MSAKRTSTNSDAFDRIHWAMNAETDSTSKHLLLIMVIHADNQTCYFYVKQNTLARESGYARQTISQHIQMLYEQGFIDFREQTNKNGYRKNHEYLVLFREDATWPDGSLPRVSQTNTGISVSRVSEDDTAVSVSRTSPCQPNVHAVSAKRTCRVSEADNINKPSNKQGKHANTQTSQLNSARARDSVCMSVEDGARPKAKRIRRGREHMQSDTETQQTEQAPSAKETPQQRMAKLRADAAARPSGDDTATASVKPDPTAERDAVPSPLQQLQQSARERAEAAA